MNILLIYLHRKYSFKTVMENILQASKQKVAVLPRIAFHTLGCKLNFSETATIARDFDSLSYKKVLLTVPLRFISSIPVLSPRMPTKD